ncbi:MAG: iron hydrogenase small subunit, partial [Selenomonadaceae bacterium]|nr:iron hydrogenase small subunit [Selenomonadaceae bacterium]
AGTCLIDQGVDTVQANPVEHDGSDDFIDIEVCLEEAGDRTPDGSAKRCSHDNTEIQSVYKEFFGKPLSEKAEKYLHTTFVNRHDRLFS